MITTGIFTALLLRLYSILCCLAAGLFSLLAYSISPAGGILLLAALVVLFVLTLNRPLAGLVAALFLVLTTGWMMTSTGSFDLHFANGILLSAVAGGLLHYSSSARLRAIHLPLFAFASLALISGVITAVKIYSFQPYDQLGYVNVAINVISTGSDAVLLNVFHATSQYLLWPALFFLGWTLMRERQDLIGGLRAALVILLPLNLLISVVQMFIVPDLFAAGGQLFDGRANGLMSFCNAMSNASGLILVFAPLWWRSSAGSRVAIINWTILIASLGLLYLGGGRAPMGYVALAGAVWLAWLLYQSENRIRLLGRISVIAGLALAGSAILLMLESSLTGQTPMLIERFGVLIENFNFEYFFFLRAGMWAFATDIIAHHFLGGVGVGTYFAELANYSALMTGEPSWFIDNALNLYLHVTAEMGVAALILICLTFAAMIRVLLRSDRRNLLLGLALICYLPVLFFGPHIINTEVGLFFWLGFGAAIGRTAAGNENLQPVRELNWQPWLLAALIALGTVFAVLGARHYSPDAMWQQLRWHLELGMHPRENEAGRRWTRPVAMTTLYPTAPIGVLRWRIGEPTAVESRHVWLQLGDQPLENRRVKTGDIQTTCFSLPWPLQPEKLLIRVDPGFTPARVSESSDERSLGLFIEDISYQWELQPLESGWYPRQEGDEFDYRWGRADAWLLLPTGADRNLRLRLPHQDSDQRPVQLTVYVDQRLVLDRNISSTDWFDISLPLQNAGQGKYDQALIRLSVDRPWIPAQHGDSEDSRELGFARQLKEQPGTSDHEPGIQQEVTQ